ncbi:MAG TPA: hypothetical protein DCZ94_02205 [Lentisphaeria bacterium]|nr:MAG: hypothetical protein A2X48_19885 [Lentisphaerae bacterium GWF2_49_21]HBC85747.1 hypothetical protein [Lentisphaeria bacterium]
MKIVDTYPEILILSDSMKNGFNMSIWECYAAQISKLLPQKLLNDSCSYNFNQEVLPIVQQALNNTNKLEETHNSFLSATQTLQQRFTGVFGTDLQADIILYLGLCNGAGWATTLDGKKAVLLGVEKIIELDWCNEKRMASLIYHELGHLWHDMAGTPHPGLTKQGEKSIWQLFREGIAMYCEQLLCGDFSYYHQDINGWRNWCESNKIVLSNEYLRRVDAGESTQDFFGDWCSVLGHSDVGYYLGCEFVKWLVKKYSLIALANMGIDVVSIELHKFLK